MHYIPFNLVKCFLLGLFSCISHIYRWINLSIITVKITKPGVSICSRNSIYLPKKFPEGLSEMRKHGFSKGLSEAWIPGLPLISLVMKTHIRELLHRGLPLIFTPQMIPWNYNSLEVQKGIFPENFGRSMFQRNFQHILLGKGKWLHSLNRSTSKIQL